MNLGLTILLLPCGCGFYSAFWLSDLSSIFSACGTHVSLKEYCDFVSEIISTSNSLNFLIWLWRHTGESLSLESEMLISLRDDGVTIIFTFWLSQEIIAGNSCTSVLPDVTSNDFKGSYANFGGIFSSGTTMGLYWMLSFQIMNAEAVPDVPVTLTSKSPASLLSIENTYNVLDARRKVTNEGIGFPSANVTV